MVSLNFLISLVKQKVFVFPSSPPQPRRWIPERVPGRMDTDIVFFVEDCGDRGFLSPRYARSFRVPMKEVARVLGLNFQAPVTAVWPPGLLGLLDDAVQFGSVQQFVHFCRALWSGDSHVAWETLGAESSWEQAECMRGSDAVYRKPGWGRMWRGVTLLGNRHKFEQNADLRGRLLETESRRLILKKRKYGSSRVRKRGRWWRTEFGGILEKVRLELRRGHDRDGCPVEGALQDPSPRRRAGQS